MLVYKNTDRSRENVKCQKKDEESKRNINRSKCELRTIRSNFVSMQFVANGVHN